jgi:PAS domain S-box-containing protein
MFGGIIAKPQSGHPASVTLAKMSKRNTIYRAAGAALAGALVLCLYQGNDWFAFKGLTKWELHILVILFSAAAVFFLAGTLLRREQRYMEESREASALSNALLESLPGVVAIIDASGRVRRSNQNFLGYSAFEAVGASIIRAVAPESVQDFQRILHCAFEQGASEGEAWLLAKDGSKLYCYLKAVRFIYEGAPCVLGMAIDITMKRRAEEQIRLQSAALECAANAIVIADAQGAIQWVNAGYTRLTGYTPEEIVGQNPRLWKSRQKDQSVYKDLLNAILSGKTWAGEIENHRKDGRAYVEEMTISPVRSKTGEITNFVAIRQDISERKRFEAELTKARNLAEVANRAKSEFLANMSHEIRTPMNGIIGMTELVLETSLTEEQRDYLLTVRQSADALLTVINDVLDFSKIEAGKLEMEKTAFSLQELLNATTQAVAPRAREKGLDLQFDLGETIPAVLVGDPFRLRQVLTNLVSNAIKFTDRGGIAIIAELQSSAAPDVVLHFQVRDTGVGIPADKLADIFQPFSQADTSTTRKYGGTGLGLTISARIVEMMNGRIWVDSVPGRGSTFHFTAQFAVADAPQLSPQADFEQLRGMPVLVVDDDAPNRRILDRFLRHWGMKPTIAESGPEALRIIEAACVRNDPFRLALLDGYMPEMDGFGLAERMRANPALRACSIMMLTSAERRGDIGRCAQMGISAYLVKPVCRPELLKGIMQALTGIAHAIPSSQDKSAPAAIPAGHRGLHVLLAEDNPTNRRLAVHFLEKAGHTVEVAENGSQALAMVKLRQFDVILMDVQMPEMDGLEATKAIRDIERHTNVHIPILALTAHAMTGDRERCLQVGMDGYITKPINRQELLAAIAEHASRSRALA